MSIFFSFFFHHSYNIKFDNNFVRLEWRKQQKKEEIRSMASQVPPELACKICGNFCVNASITPCCKNNICEKCIYIFFI